MTGQQLKNSILQLAIEGKLVPQDPNDEPASVLLERIKAERVSKNPSDKRHYENITENVPFELPKSWVWVRLGDIGTWKSGSTPSKSNLDYYKNGNILWLTTGELNNGIVYDTKVKISQQALESCSLKLCKIGDVLIAMYGATIGKVAIVGREMTTNQACCACSLHYDYNLYLFWLLQAYKPYFIKMGEGGAQPNISKEKIINTVVPFPPLNEQKRIVAKIEELLPLVDEYSKAQEALDKLNAKLPDDLRKSILQQAIEGKLVPQDPNDEPASELLKRINPNLSESCDNPHYENLPQTWKCLKLKDVCQLQDGIKAEGNHIILDAKYLRGRTSGTLCYKGKLVKKGELQILVDGENSGEVFTAPCDGYMGSTFKKLCINNELYAPYILYFITLHKDMLRNSKKGAAIPHLNKEIFYNLIIGIPPFEEQKRIVSKIESLFETLDTIKSLVN